MLNVFPDLLAFGLIAPFILRLALGVIFFDFGVKKLMRDREVKTSLFEAIGLRPGKRFALIVGLIELVVGAFLVMGFLTQIAAIVAILISGTAYYLKGRHPEHLQNSRKFFVLIGIIAFSLLFSGAGFLAIDYPL